MAPVVPLRPTKPQQAAGIRVDPAPSLPSPIGPMPAATAAAAPPLDPPGVRSVFHGLRVTPKIGPSVWPLMPNSGVVVLPIMIAPAVRNLLTSTSSRSGT